MWWHVQMEHSQQHSDAIQDANQQMIHSTAIVNYHPPCVGHDIYKHSSVDNEGHKEIKFDPHMNKNMTQDKVMKRQDNAVELVTNGNLKGLIDEIKKGLNPSIYRDKNGSTLLHWAAGSGQLSIIQYLVASNKNNNNKPYLDPNVQQNGKSSFKYRTPLHWSARNNHIEAVRFLVESCKANVDSRTDDGTTPFMLASWMSNLEVMRYLHESGKCDVHAFNQYGCSAVLWSSQGPNTKPFHFEYLWSIRCDFKKVNNNGHGVLHKLCQRGNFDLYRFLLLAKEEEENCGEDGDHEDIVKIKKGKNDANCSLHQWDLRQVAPDADGFCPSDLAGTEGHKELAEFAVEMEHILVSEWLLKKEKCFTFPPAGYNECWIQDHIQNVSRTNTASDCVGKDYFWGPCGGADRMKSVIVKNKVTSYCDFKFDV